jgi:hypothetical protein
MQTLDYHVAQRRLWVRYALLAGLCALLIGVSKAVYVQHVAPRLQLMTRQRQRAVQIANEQRMLAGFCSFPPDEHAPVAAVVLDTALERDPAALTRHGQIAVGILSPNTWRLDHPIHLRLRFSPWIATQDPYPFEHATTVYLGKRTTPDGRDYLVVLDICVNGTTFYFHACTIDLGIANVAVRLFETNLRASRTTDVAEFSFLEDTGYLMPAAADPNDASAFTFVILHGDCKDFVTARLMANGSLQLEPKVQPGVENRWRLNPKR